jgi:hypothetical protein
MSSNFDCSAHTSAQMSHGALPRKSLTFMVQTLLQRHESAVASFAEERRALTMQIDQLSLANEDLESRNRSTLLENRQLVEQLENLNQSISDQDDRILDLTSGLRKTEEELARVGRAGRSIPDLERQLERLEQDLADAQSREEQVGEEGKVTSLRWQQAEKTVEFLQEQLESIEREAKEERDRHADVLSRIQRRRTVEAELARKLPWKSQQDSHTDPQESQADNNGVVTHFVTDILQDNANLQLALVELRDMLQQSNDEVELLRGHIVQSPTVNEGSVAGSSSMHPETLQNLGSELAGSPKQEIHVHHHYHGPSRRSVDVRQSRSTSSRRKGKKRDSGSLHTPRSSISGLKSPTSALLSQTSASIPRTLNAGSSKRWSTHSNQTGFTSASSMPGSPYESIFDRSYGDAATDVSRPSTPESFSLSPTTSADPGGLHEAMRDSLASIIVSPPPELSEYSGLDISIPLSSSAPVKSSISAVKGHAREPSYQDPSHSIILEENEDLDTSVHIIQTNPTSTSESTPIPIPQSASSSRPGTASRLPNLITQTIMPDLIRPTLRRHASHESLISVGGMDIHTLQTRPSQLLLGKYFTSPNNHQMVRAIPQSVISAEHARPHNHRRESEGDETVSRSTSASYLSGIIASQGSNGTRRSLPGNNNSRTSLGGKVGGWMFGKRWGSTSESEQPVEVPKPAEVPKSVEVPKPVIEHRPSTASTASTISALQSTSITGAASSPSPSASQVRSKKPIARPFLLRPPGVNQSGPIFGFGPEKKLEPVVVVSGLNVDALRESLADDAGVGPSGTFT